MMDREKIRAEIERDLMPKLRQADFKKLLAKAAADGIDSNPIDVLIYIFEELHVKATTEGLQNVAQIREYLEGPIDES